MLPNRKLIPTLTIAAGLAFFGSLSVSQTDAAILLNFDFTVSNDNNSPAHQDGGVTGTSWNLLTGDKLTGIVSDSGAATSVGVNLGKETAANSNIMNFNRDGYTQIGPTTTFYQSSGVYAGNAKSFTFVNDGKTAEIAIGARISGLGAGTYDVYLVARNTATTEAEIFNTYFGTIATSDLGTAYDYSGLTSVTEAAPASSPSAAYATWTNGTTYVMQQVSLTDLQDLVVIDQLVGNRGFFNMIEIVPVSTPTPEPASLSLLAIGSLILLSRRKQRA